MKQILLTLICCFIFNANAALCTTTTDTGKKTFMFDKDKPTKTLSGTVAALKQCAPNPKLIESAAAQNVDDCIKAIVTYINRDTKVQETFYYINGATSADGIKWEGVQNPGCPAIK